VSFKEFIDQIAEAIAAKVNERQRLTKRLLTLEEACEYTGLTEDGIRCKVAAGKIPVTRIDRKLRFDRLKLDHLIEEKTRVEE
jgi:excisionase family DNA binding protein